VGLTREDVQRVALLGRLQLNADELETMTVQLSQIVQYVQLMSELETTDVAPLAHPIETTNVLVADEPQPSLDREAALANAPKRDEECYRVPAVLGD
jgi:aspartyl-tRNA(Asn)/glutamyl-tRNA(Gln) amidotransferase subunit C